jgi:hypothetical protein
MDNNNNVNLSLCLNPTLWRRVGKAEYLQTSPMHFAILIGSELRESSGEEFCSWREPSPDQSVARSPTDFAVLIR